MQQIFGSLNDGMAESFRALFFLIVPPWLPLVVVWIRNSERHLVLWSGTLGIVGGVLAHPAVPGVYFWSECLEVLGLVGVPAAALSGLIYGAALGLLAWSLIRGLRRLGREPRYL